MSFSSDIVTRDSFPQETVCSGRIWDFESIDFDIRERICFLMTKTIRWGVLETP